MNNASDINARVSARLRAARLVARLTQEEAAAVLNVTFQQLQKYEKGVNRISAGNLALLARAYGKPLAWFFDGVDEVDHVDDTTAEFFRLPYAADLARNFIAIESDGNRRVVLQVSDALAGKGGAT